MIQIGEQNDEEKPKFASVKKDQSIQTISLNDALELFKYPKTIGEFEGSEIKVNVGRFGPYIQHDKKFVSINAKLGDKIESITAERAIELILAKREDDKNKTIKIFEEDNNVQLLNGRYGAYLKIGKDNFKLPKNTDPTKLSFQECLDIAASQAKPAKGKAPAGKKASKKSDSPAKAPKKTVQKKAPAQKPAADKKTTSSKKVSAKSATTKKTVKKK
jgi:DNA topoisomerase-1